MGTRAAKNPVLPQDGAKGGEDSSHFIVSRSTFTEIGGTDDDKGNTTRVLRV